MARSIVDVSRLVAVLGALALVVAGCQVQDSPIGNSGGNGGGGDTAGGGQVSEDPEEVPDDEVAISGMVYDIETQAPISGALVMTEPSIGQIRTNGQGMYVFTAATFPSLNVGTPYRITAQANGYIQNFAQVTADTRHQRNVDIPLQKGAAEFTIKVSQLNLTFTDQNFLGGAMTSSQQINLQLEGAAAQTVAYSINIPPQESAWLSASPATGQLSGTPVFLTITVNKEGLAAGTYNGSVNVVAEGGLATIQVQLTVGDAAAGPDDGTDGATDVPDPA